MAAKLRVVMALALLSLLGASGQPLAQKSDRSAAELMDVVMWNREPIGGPFALIDQNGARRTDADFRGQFMLIYFGFTYCPDVCPTDLQQMGMAVDQLGSAGDAVQPIFITVDPERDTPEHLKDYGVGDPKVDPNAPDMVLFANEGWVFGDTAAGAMSFVDKPERAGSHGHDPNLPDLHATFVAWGMGIKPGVNLGPIDNSDVAPTIGALIHVEIPNADGKVLKDALAQ